MSLELMAMHYLRFEKSCPYALFERNPRWGLGSPDVLGVTKAGYLYEIEIKRTLSDFKANGHKRHIKNKESNQDWIVNKWPKQFWFLVPDKLVSKVLDIVPEYAGLLRGPKDDEQPVIRVVKDAPWNNKSQRLSIKECINLGRCMSNQILSLANSLDMRDKNLNCDGYFYGEFAFPVI